MTDVTKQYTVEITDGFKYRQDSHKTNSRKFDRKESCMLEHLYRHFSSPGHTQLINDLSATLIDKTDISNPANEQTTE